MSIALYYPHTALTDKALMKSCLLLWDHVEFISPSPDYAPEVANDPEMREAAELVTRPYVPTNEDHAAADERILQLARKPHPDWLLYNKPALPIDDQQYQMFRTKFGDEVLIELVKRQIAAIPAGDPHDFATRTSFGLLMMGILAARCAGTVKTMITDRVEQYQALAKYFTFENDGKWMRQPITAATPSQSAQQAEQSLVTISLKVIDPRGIPFSRLLEMRRSESAPAVKLRHTYANTIQQYTAKIVDAKSTVDRQAIEQEFEDEMRHCLAALKHELKIKARQILLSREMLVSVVASVAAAPVLLAGNVDPAFAGLIGIGTLGKLWADHRSARDQALKDNPIGYLYKSKRFPYY